MVGLQLGTTGPTAPTYQVWNGSILGGPLGSPLPKMAPDLTDHQIFIPLSIDFTLEACRSVSVQGKKGRPFSFSQKISAKLFHFSVFEETWSACMKMNHLTSWRIWQHKEAFQQGLTIYVSFLFVMKLH